MPPPRPRSKMLSVRLSDDEYRELKTLCAIRDVRSVSEVARRAMQALLSDGASVHLDPPSRSYTPASAPSMGASPAWTARSRV